MEAREQYVTSMKLRVDVAGTSSDRLAANHKRSQDAAAEHFLNKRNRPSNYEQDEYLESLTEVCNSFFTLFPFTPFFIWCVKSCEVHNKMRIVSSRAAGLCKFIYEVDFFLHRDFDHRSRSCTWAIMLIDVLKVVFWMSICVLISFVSHSQIWLIIILNWDSKMIPINLINFPYSKWCHSQEMECCFLDFEKQNMNSNRMAMQVAEYKYDNYISTAWGPQACCFHPRALKNLHAEAKQSAVRQFLASRTECENDDFGKKLEGVSLFPNRCGA